MNNSGFFNFTKIIMATLMKYGGLPKVDVAKKLLFFDAYGAFVLEGGETRVIRQIKDVCVWVPFSMGVHCVVHRINLGIQSLSNWTLFV